MTDQRIVGHMVTRNENGRYLEAAIAWLASLTDVVHVHDDRSTDGTYEHLVDLGVSVSRRESSEPSFAENESAFRQSAWRAMERTLDPTSSDWILCLDADELLLGHCANCETREVLNDQVGSAEALGLNAVTFEVAEVFRFDGDEPMIRVDGFWGEIEACRLVRWRPDGTFGDRREGCGSVPVAWRDLYTSLVLTIVHLGYARLEDRVAKYDRYRASSGHNRQHVESILRPPLLTSWIGQRLPVEVRT